MERDLPSCHISWGARWELSELKRALFASATPSRYVFNSTICLSVCLCCFVRSWIHRLQGTMSKETRLSLPCYAEDTEFKMVNHYIDRGGCNRVWGPELLL